MKLLQNIPNILTTLRGVAGLILPIIFFNVSQVATLITFLAASLTDLFDGALARIIPDGTSDYGKTMDPIFDKLLGFSALIISTLFINPFMAISLALETPIAIVNIINFFKTKKIEASKIGKIKTVALFITICLSFIPGISPVALGIALALATALQIKALEGYVKELKNAKTKKIKEIKAEELKKEEKFSEEYNKEFLGKKLQKEKLKEKYLSLQKIAQDIVVSKEAFERKLGEKIFSRKLEK